MTWTHSGVVYNPVFMPGGVPPSRVSSIDLGQHSAATMVVAGVRQFVGEPIFRRSMDGGMTWSAAGAHGFMGNFGALRIHVPYVSATWNDSLGYLITDDGSNGLINIARSTNLNGATGSVTWSQRGCVLSGGDPLTHGHKWFDVCFENPDHLALVLSPGGAAGGGSYILVYISDDGGLTWTLWYKSSSVGHKLSSAAFFNWSGQNLATILVHDYLEKALLMITSSGMLDKTGDLYTVAPTLDYVTMIDRDTMGAA